MSLILKNINKENFSQYGQLISTKNIKSEYINNGTSKSFFDLVDIEIMGNDKKCRVNIGRICRHYKSCCQAFIIIIYHY